MTNVNNIEQLRGREGTIGVGSVVTLKGGGPAMTVLERSADKAHCCWHIDDGSLHDAWVLVAILKMKP